MRSSAIISISKLLHENRSNQVLLANASELLSPVSLLLKEECIEQTRAVMGYFRVCISILPEDKLTDAVAIIIPVMFQDLGSIKSKFTSRIRGVLRKLMKRIDLESVREMIPESDIALLDYIQKHSRRDLRNKQKAKVSAIEKLLGSDSEER